MPQDAQVAVKTTILLVDDDPIMRELARANLNQAGYEVIEAENGSIAFECLKKNEVDLVISDLDMPVMTGFELTRAIRAHEPIVDMPVIVITANDHADAVEKAFAAGATSFLAKPINWTLFSQAVLFVLRASRDQKSLQTARDLAEAGAKFKDSLMSVMSHELRTPLNAIIGFGQLLSDGFEEQKDTMRQEYAAYIVGGGKRLLNSVSDMLLASDARSGPITINDADNLLGELVEHARENVQDQVALADAKITIALHDPNIEVRCDRQLMARAIAKLIDNSVKFGPKGVQIVVGSALTKTGALAILVKDNGPGIPAEKMKDLTTAFTQTDMSLRRSKEGLGLGLPLVQAIANAHDGILNVSSIEADGAKALLVLPVERLVARAVNPSACVENKANAA